MARKRIRHYSGIGGQAVLEGVMMKNQDLYAVAVRRSNGEIVVDTKEFAGILHDSFFSKIPFVRGVLNFIDSMSLGIKALNYSADFYEDEETEQSAADKAVNKVTGGRAEGVFMAITLIVSIALCIGIFIALPYYLSTLFGKYVRNDSLLNIIEGVIRIVIFLTYVVLISIMKDIRRVYMYHGAEHKCINCIERGRELNVRNVKRCSRLHRRCGTSFLLFVMMVSIILFFFIRVTNPVYRIVLRIALIPLVAGISYEIIRLVGRFDNTFVRVISIPGMMLQRLTTKEPDEAMIEVAIRSVEAVFDWKEFLKQKFNYDVDAQAAKEAKLRAESEAEEAREREREALWEAAQERALRKAKEVISAGERKNRESVQPPREQPVTEQAEKEQPAKEQAAKEQTPKKQPRREGAAQHAKDALRKGDGQ